MACANGNNNLLRKYIYGPGMDQPEFSHEGTKSQIKSVSGPWSLGVFVAKGKSQIDNRKS